MSVKHAWLVRFALILSALCVGTLLSAQSSPPNIVTKAELDRWKKELSNWGRWGKDDQIGALNLITSATRRRAVALVKTGDSISLSRSLDTEKSVENSNPFEHTMLALGMDRVSLVFHG